MVTVKNAEITHELRSIAMEEELFAVVTIVHLITYH